MELCIRDFIEIVSEGKVFAVSQFIKLEYSSNICNRNGVSLLNLAARNGHKKTVTILIDNGAEIDLVSGDRGNTPIMDAVGEGYVEILNTPLSVGASLNI